jgi:hypothetical protein
VDADAGDAGWIDVAAGELRLRRDDGRLLWSQTLPDVHAGLARLEFGGTELESLEEDEADEGGFAHEHG